MKFWKNFSIGAKYASAFGMTILLFAIALFIVYFELDIAQTHVEELDQRGVTAIEVGEMASLARTKDIRIADYVREPRRTYVEEFEQRRERFNELQEKYTERFKGTELEPMLITIGQQDNEINSIFLEQMVGNVSNTDEINKLRNQTQNLRSDLVDTLTELQSTAEDDMQGAMTGTKDILNKTVFILIVAAAVALVTGVLLIWLVNRKIRKRLNSLVTRADQIAAGELYHELEHDDQKDEIGQLNGSMSHMQINLEELIKEITVLSNQVNDQSHELQQSSSEVQEASEQVAATMEQMSSSSEQQAGDATTLTEMMEQLGQKIQASNDTGVKVAERSREVMEQSNTGQELMNLSVTQMKEIHEVMEIAVQKVVQLDRQSEEISKLVQVIRDIADQTNLLALNAAIEAARAGEHGQGFAVVADEVRKLAEQVSDSVGEITHMVENIQSDSKEVSTSLESGYEKVEKGTDQIQKTGQTFEEIQKSIQTMVEGIDQISENLEDINDNTMTMNQSIESVASSSEEAAAGVQQTSASLQQTNSSMEHVAHHSKQLASMSQRLNELMKQFKISN